jgi:hypothetical protein
MLESEGGKRDLERCAWCERVLEPGEKHDCPKKPQEIMPGFWRVGNRFIGFFGEKDDVPLPV